MSLDKISTSLVSGVNETTLALANMQLDISLVKFEVPVEYGGLSAALTSNRRDAAEQGTAHRTARRLGILFQDILPPSPELLRAYGRRATEITGKSSSSNERNISNGIFANFLGADITSVWAAATSGASSIAVHLLACLLARLWSGPEATSIWVEIVAERKRRIQSEEQQGVYKTSLELQIVSRQEISRNDLAEWDAGARAWLQIADDAQMRRHKQLMLIINNIHLPVNTGGSTFERVMDAWTKALGAMEKLVCGQPQRVVKGATLMGIASWHIYPDLLILGNTISTVKFRDDLVPDTAQVTIGLENVDSEKQDGIFWSLPLSHLRFYGDPVVARSYTTRDASRFSMEELQMLAFGSAMSTWGSHFMDPCDVARFFRALSKQIDDASLPSLGWLSPLLTASEALLIATGDELENNLAIVALGRRNGRQFLSETHFHPLPYLGLGHPFVSHLLKRPKSVLDQQPLERMRFIASQLGLRPDDCIIRSCRHPASPNILSWPDLGFPQQPEESKYEYLTAIPHTNCNFKGMGPSHIRWIENQTWDWDTGGLFFTKISTCMCHSKGYDCHSTRCTCMQGKVPCTPLCHRAVSHSAAECAGSERTGAGMMSQNDSGSSNGPLGCANMPVDGEFMFRCASGFCSEFTPGHSSARLALGLGITRPEKGHPGHPDLFIRLNPARGRICGCYLSAEHTNAPSPSPEFCLLAGDPEDVALFVRTDVGLRARRQRLRYALSHLASKGYADGKSIIADLESGSFQRQTLSCYLESYSEKGFMTLPSFAKDLYPEYFHVQKFVLSLNALAVASDTYKSLAGATSSLRVIERPLYTAQWVPADVDFWAKKNRRLERRQQFACIAFFESGSYNMNPSDLTEVIAMSTRNSIYVSATLLSDPFEMHHRHEIRHVVGNVGKTGMVMMVAPLAPRIRPPDLGKWKQISHAPFHGHREDCFQPTSLHLSFTEFEMPVDIGQRGSIDKDIQVRVVETVISVFDRGKWVADLDVLLLYEPMLQGHAFVKRLDETSGPGCKKPRQHHGVTERLTSIDNWEELLNVPEDIGQEHIGVVRASENWLARVATACVAVQKGFRTLILPSSGVCWECCSKKYRWKKVQGGDDGSFRRQNQVSIFSSGIHEDRFGEVKFPEPAESMRFEEDDDEDFFEDNDFDYSSDDSDVTVITVKEGYDSFEALPQVFIC